VNALLHQRPQSNASSNAFDDEEAVDGIGNENGSDSASMDYGNEAPVVAPPAVVAPPKVVAPLARITSARKVGSRFRVVVAAPQGSKVVLYRNGKKIASGKKTTFMVSLGKLKSARIHAVAISNGSYLATQKVVVRVKSTSSRK
jgi:hypothetical protein